MAESNAPTFKDENRALQELAREQQVLREHNLSFREGNAQQTLLLMAEAALTVTQRLPDPSNPPGKVG